MYVCVYARACARTCGCVCAHTHVCVCACMCVCCVCVLSTCIQARDESIRHVTSTLYHVTSTLYPLPPPVRYSGEMVDSLLHSENWHLLQHRGVVKSYQGTDNVWNQKILDPHHFVPIQRSLLYVNLNPKPPTINRKTKKFSIHTTLTQFKFNLVKQLRSKQQNDGLCLMYACSRMYVYVNVYMYVYMYTQIPYGYVNVYMNVYTCTQIPIQLIYVRVYIYKFRCICMCIHIQIPIYVCVYMYKFRYNFGSCTSHFPNVYEYTYI